MTPETVLLHQSILRALKGLLHAYEVWIKRTTGAIGPTVELPRDRSGESP